MAKVTYGVAIGENTDIQSYYSNLKLDHASKTEIDYEDKGSHAEIEFHGTGLAVDKHGIISKGMIDEIEFNDAQGKSLVHLDVEAGEPKIDAAGARDAYVNAGVLGLMMYVFKGDDTFVGSNHGDWINSWDGDDKINGRGGDDFIAGYSGKDKLTGGAGNDVFIFGGSYGKDVITDFDADGGKGHQDLIWALDSDYKIVKDGHDTVIDFHNGETLTLQNVARSHISAADFYS